MTEGVVAFKELLGLASVFAGLEICGLPLTLEGASKGQVANVAKPWRRVRGP